MDNFNTSSNPQMDNPMMPARPLPNATAVLILGIVSILGCCCYGILGLICGIIALVLAKKDMALYNMNPAAYTPSSYSNIKTGRILAIIGLIFSALYIVYVIFLISFVGFEALSNPEQMREVLEQYMNR